MTPVGDYLKKLLYQYDCLVVPELGAFLTHYLPASFSESAGQYLPPCKRLAFNEMLRLDDGILINYIMLHESCTRGEALHSIGTFVSGIKQQIRASGSFTLDGIGLLTTNEEGKFQFHPELRHNFFAESFGLTALPAQYWQSTASIPVLVLPVNTNQSLAIAGSNADDGKLMQMPVGRSPWYWAAATLLIGSLATLSYLSVVQPNQSLQSSLSPASLLRFPAFLPKPTETPVVKLRPVTEVANVNVVVTPKVVNPVAVVSVPVTKGVRSVAPVATVKIPVIVVPVKKAIALRVAPTTPKVSRSSAVLKPFLVVAGSFSSRRNALGLRRQLKKAGFDDAYLMMPVRRRELIKVAAFGALTLAEADTVMVKVSALTGVPAWLMRTRR